MRYKHIIKRKGFKMAYRGHLEEENLQASKVAGALLCLMAVAGGLAIKISNDSVPADQEQAYLNACPVLHDTQIRQGGQSLKDVSFQLRDCGNDRIVMLDFRDGTFGVAGRGPLSSEDPLRRAFSGLRFDAHKLK